MSASLPSIRGQLLAPRKQPGNLLVRPVDVVYGEDSEVAIVSEITQGDAGTGLDLELVDGLLRQVERNRDAEEHAIGETALLDDTARGKTNVSTTPSQLTAIFSRELDDLPIVVLLVQEACSDCQLISFLFLVCSSRGAKSAGRPVLGSR
jgi:hypothetical protein